jgi:hypothetical protein
MPPARAACTLLALAFCTLPWLTPGDAFATGDGSGSTPSADPGGAPNTSTNDTAAGSASPDSTQDGGSADVSPAAAPDSKPVTTVVVAATPGPATPPPARRNYVAVVVGISAYQHLPDEVELDFARSDAATVAQALKQDAGFNEVFLLGDGEATRARVQDILRTKVPQVVGPDDVLVVYYAGHGIGADLGLPVILTHDSTLENGQNDGLEIGAFARDLQTWTRAGTTLIVTDVIHRNQLDGISFFGPAATEWPALPKNWMVLSSSPAQSPAADGAFGTTFAEAMGGAADADRDTYVTAGELFAWLVSRLSPQGQIPVAGGQYDGGMVVAAGVRKAPAAVKPPDPVAPTVIVERIVEKEPEKPKVVYPDYNVPKAKFVWEGGSGQNVQCREQAVTACAPSCYVYNFLAGPCTLSAIYDGVQMSGEAVVLGPGGYTCKRKGGALECSLP